MSRLSKILQPKSIAVIGASRKEGSLGKMFLEALLRMNFTGAIYPINPKADFIDGIKVYSSLDTLPGKADLAVILLSYQYVLPAVDELAKAGVKDIIVISAGFKEVGGEGIRREEDLKILKQKYNLNILGPNCMGAFNTDAAYSFNGTFSPTLPLPGHVAYISQSGALGVAVLELNAHSDLGFSVFVSTGNKADISDTDVLDFLAEDDNTHVVTMYMESIDQPRSFQAVSRKLAAKKPLLAVKAGRTESGHKAASSHTGALANPEHIVDGFLKQCGIIRKNTLEELFDAARAFSLQPLPAGKRVAVITNAGGPGILSTDAIERSGLKLTEFSAETIEGLTAALPAEAAKSNPVDMIASANETTYRDVMKIILQDDGVDAIVLIIVKPPVNSTPRKIAEALEAVIQSTSKTIIPVVMADHDTNAGLDVFQRLSLPVYSYPESAVSVLATMWQYKEMKDELRNTETDLSEARASEPLQDTANGQADIGDLFRLLKKYQLPTAPFLLSESVEELVAFQKQVAGKVVLKTANAQIIHKSDEGLLYLNLLDETAVRSAFESIREAVLPKLPRGVKPIFLIQQQLLSGSELVLGGKRDAAFGPVIMAGFGGIFVEVLKDVVFRVAPISVDEALDMLSDIKAQALFDGARGRDIIDRNALAQIVSNFSRLLAEHPEIQEMDLNPLIWSAEQNTAVTVDARATITKMMPAKADIQ